ncbi:ATP-binding protein [Streptomyces kebangsaanensis]|uniref:ATP-binding protein n=1 Tax=Streptomyces kebangsaanensis TaxID=864058 RepID=UPI000939A518|nr:ATP-binding protein [Streptomyces kebangsaanensis]
MNAEISPPETADGHRAEVAASPRHFTIRLSATRRGARLARRLACEQLDSWGWPYDSDAHRTAALLVGELAANAALHGREKGRDFRLGLTFHLEDSALRIEVTDPRPDRRPPGPGLLQPPSSEGESGRGLLLVEVLADHWGTTCGDPYTKTVWCEVTLR